MKNFFRISSSSDNITPLSPNLPPPVVLNRASKLNSKLNNPGSAFHTENLRNKKNVNHHSMPALSLGQSYQTIVAQENKQLINASGYTSPIGCQKLQHPIQFKKMQHISAPLDNMMSISGKTENQLDNKSRKSNELRFYRPNTLQNPLNFAGANPVALRNLSTQTMPFQNQTERLARSFSDSSIFVEPAPTSLASHSNSIIYTNNSEMSRNFTACTAAITNDPTTPESRLNMSFTCSEKRSLDRSRNNSSVATLILPTVISPIESVASSTGYKYKDSKDQTIYNNSNTMNSANPKEISILEPVSKTDFPTSSNSSNIIKSFDTAITGMFFYSIRSSFFSAVYSKIKILI